MRLHVCLPYSPTAIALGLQSLNKRVTSRFCPFGQTRKMGLGLWLFRFSMAIPITIPMTVPMAIPTTIPTTLIDFNTIQYYSILFNTILDFRCFYIFFDFYSQTAIALGFQSLNKRVTSRLCPFGQKRKMGVFRWLFLWLLYGYSDGNSDGYSYAIPTTVPKTFN